MSKEENPDEMSGMDAALLRLKAREEAASQLTFEKLKEKWLKSAKPQERKAAIAKVLDEVEKESQE